MTLRIVVDNTKEPCNTCGKIQGDCECKCSFCKKLKRDVPDQKLISGDNAMICDPCLEEATWLVRQ